jgi:hypothetical protein
VEIEKGRGKGRCKKRNKKLDGMKRSVRRRKKIAQALVFNSLLPSSSFNVIAIR